MKLFFIRHAETQVNADNLTHKTHDPAGLTERGTMQAQQLIDFCRAHTVEAIYSSPEVRARETARIIAQGICKTSEIIEELSERNWGKWEGKPWREIEEQLSPMTIDQRYRFIPPGGESWHAMEERLKKALDLIVRTQFQIVAIVTHQGALRCLMPLLSNQQKESSLRHHFENAQIIAFDYRNGRYLREVSRTIVAILLFSKDGRLFMGKKDPIKGGVYPDCWHIPGGGVDEREDLTHAIVRETREETGIDITSYAIELADNEGRGEAEKVLKDTGERALCTMHFTVYKAFIHDKNSCDIKVTLGDDLHEYQWVDPGDLKSLKLTPPSESLFKRLGLIDSRNK